MVWAIDKNSESLNPNLLCQKFIPNVLLMKIKSFDTLISNISLLWYRITCWWITTYEMALTNYFVCYRWHNVVTHKFLTCKGLWQYNCEQLTPWSTVLEKLTFTQLGRNSLPFMEPRSSLPCTLSWASWTQSTHSHTSSYPYTSVPGSPLWSYPFTVFIFPCMLHVLPISPLI
jgi:hypothetical protein